MSFNFRIVVFNGGEFGVVDYHNSLLADHAISVSNDQDLTFVNRMLSKTQKVKTVVTLPQNWLAWSAEFSMLTAKPVGNVGIPGMKWDSFNNSQDAFFRSTPFVPDATV